MEFKLNLPIAPPPFQISHGNKLLLVGSCFATHIGEKLHLFKFNTFTNPCGIVFNPVSIANSINLAIQPDKIQNDFFFYEHQQWHSWLHHTGFNHPDYTTFKEQINIVLQAAHQQILEADYIFITPGTAYVYRHKALNQIVSNCHKMPSNLFDKILLSPQEVTDALGSAILNIKNINPKAKIIFTVSPVKHLKDGVHNNNVSKGVLLYAVSNLCSKYDNTYYFPAYEIVNDELRDYRFYKPDFAHPSDLAVDYVWQRFQETFFNAETRELVHQISKINNMLQHKPLSLNGYADFLNRTKEKIKALQNMHNSLDFTKEITHIDEKLNELQ